MDKQITINYSLFERLAFSFDAGIDHDLEMYFILYTDDDNVATTDEYPALDSMIKVYKECIAIFKDQNTDEKHIEAFNYSIVEIKDMKGDLLRSFQSKLPAV